jgi:hypothetical protein
MTTFRFTSPEGQVYSIQGPEGATQEQAWNILQQKMEAESGSEATSPAEELVPKTETAADDVGIGKAMLIGAGRGLLETKRGLQDLTAGIAPWGPYERDPVEEKAYAELKEERPIATGIGEAAPYLAGAGAAGVATKGLGTGAQVLGQMRAAGALGLAQPGTEGERVLRGATDAGMALLGEGIGRGVVKAIAPGKAPKSLGKMDNKIVQAATKDGYKVLPSGRSSAVVDKPIESSSMMAPAVKRINKYNQNLLNKHAYDFLGGTEKGNVITSHFLSKREATVRNNFRKIIPDKSEIPAGTFADPNLTDNVIGSMKTLGSINSPVAQEAIAMIKPVIENIRSGVPVKGEIITGFFDRANNFIAKTILKSPEEAVELNNIVSAVRETLQSNYLSKTNAARLLKQSNYQKRINFFKQPGVISPEGVVNPKVLAGTLNSISPDILNNINEPFIHGLRLLGTTQLAKESTGTGLGSLFMGAAGGSGIGGLGYGGAAFLSGDSNSLEKAVTGAAVGAGLGVGGTKLAEKALPTSGFANWMSRTSGLGSTTGPLVNGFLRTALSIASDDKLNAMPVELVQERLNSRSPQELLQELNRYIRGRKLSAEDRKAVKEIRNALKIRASNGG